MSNILLWVGLFFIVGLSHMLKAFGLEASDVLVVVGSIIMGIGVILLIVEAARR